MFKKEMKLRGALPDDLEKIVDILERSGLPTVDCEEHLSNFFVMEDANRILGVGGFQSFGNIALVRSMAVEKRCRGRGVGGMLYKGIEKKALSLGIKELYLLTDSAVEFFKNIGFTQIVRTKAPTQIMASRQFQALCAKTTAVMHKHLPGKQ